jgi:hypothetical protein
MADTLPSIDKNDKLSETFFARLFYSPQNKQKILELLRFLVYKNMGDVIDHQPEDALTPIMREIYFNFSKHPIDITTDMNPEQKNYLIAQYKREIIRLNEIVIRRILPMTLSNLQQFKDYLRDIDSLQIQDYAKNVSTAGMKSLPFSQI